MFFADNIQSENDEVMTLIRSMNHSAQTNRSEITGLQFMCHDLFYNFYIFLLEHN